MTSKEQKTIILLHGFLADSTYWRKLVPYLQKAHYKVVAIDLLGFGKAPKPKDNAYDYDSHIQYIVHKLRELNVTNATLVGHSMGALLALRLVRVHPHLVDRLLLLHPPLYNSSAEAHKTLRETSSMYRFLLDSPLRRLGWITLKLLAFGKLSHSRIARERSLANVIEQPQVFDDLQQVQVSTLLLIGSKDRSIYQKNIHRSKVAPLVHVKIENFSHHSPRHNTSEVADMLLQFLEK